MRQLDLWRLLVRPVPALLTAGAVAMVAAGVGAAALLTRAAPKAAAPLDPAAIAALQNAAFTQAEAQPGLAPPQSVPVKLQRGETLEGAVRRAGVGPAEAQLAVEMLSKAMDTVHLKAGMLIQTAITQPRAGEAKNSWLTGTAAWNFVAVSQYLLGVRPDFDGLRVAPVIAKEVPSFTVTRKCRGAEYVIHVKNSGSGGPARLVVDGKAIAGDLVPYAAPGATVTIHCEV